MQSKLTITKVHPSYGQAPRLYHQSNSEIVAEEHGGSLAISIKQGERRSPEDAPSGMASTPEAVAAIYLDRDEVRALAAFLANLPQD